MAAMRTSRVGNFDSAPPPIWGRVADDASNSGVWRCRGLLGLHRPGGTRPSIVLIISDDHGWPDYGFMGHPLLNTPVGPRRHETVFDLWHEG